MPSMTNLLREIARRLRRGSRDPSASSAEMAAAAVAPLLAAIEAVTEQNKRLVEERALLTDHVLAVENVCRELVRIVSGARGFDADAWAKAMSLGESTRAAGASEEHIDRIRLIMREIGGVALSQEPFLRVIQGGRSGPESAHGRDADQAPHTAADGAEGAR